MANTMTKRISDDLIEKWIRGDRESARRLYDRYYKRAWKFGLAITHLEEEADELAQAAITHGLDVVRDPQRRPEKFTGWLLGVVKHMAWRREGRRPQPLPVELSMEDHRHGRPSGALIDAEMKAVLNRALGKLPAPERQVIEERYVGGASRAELAQKLGCSLDTVDRRTKAAFERLRDSLSGHFTTLVLAGDPPTMERIMELRPSFRAAFLSRHVDGLTPEQAAEKLRIPLSTLEARMKFAYETLGCSERSDFAALRRPV